MLGWLRKCLRKWLLGPDSTVIEIVLQDGTHRAIATHAVGLRLMCTIPHEGGVRQQLIGEWQAVHRDQFWKLWSQLGGIAEWEDGSPFKPPTRTQGDSVPPRNSQILGKSVDRY